MLRVPSWREGELAALELRTADPMANPYLALAAILATTLDGIRRGDEPPEPLEESSGSYDDEGLQRSAFLASPQPSVKRFTPFPRTLLFRKRSVRMFPTSWSP